jgi:starch-binding outer membrane protein, SusD/RagB family
MKKIRIPLFTISLIFWVLLGCESTLNTEVFSELTPETILQSEDGIERVLNSAYSYMQLTSGPRRHYFFSSGASTGTFYVRGGSVESRFYEYESFTWKPDHSGIISYWQDMYRAIRDANIVLENINNENFDETFINLKTAEAKFIRAFSYSELYKQFGPTPLITTSDEVELPREANEEMLSFIESELLESANALPLNGQEFGRANKGTALGVLAKYYLNTKEWGKAAELTKEIIQLGKYKLLENFEDIFSLDNEGNDEIIFAFCYNPFVKKGNRLLSLFFPTDFPAPPNVQFFAARTFYYDNFLNSFEEGDTRRQLFINEYVSKTGKLVVLGNNQNLSLKYPVDPNAEAGASGNDIPIIRYSDILLTRAESLNELNGPTQESIDLIHEVRERAGVSMLNVSDFNQTSLREQILKEREWEFWAEIKEREDQIRHGVFISRAQARGHNAKPHHVLFPIPQAEIDSNSEIVQNEGY